MRTNFRGWVIMSITYIACFLANFTLLYAQNGVSTRYINAAELGVSGKVEHEGHLYHRVDTGRHADLPTNVKFFWTHAAGTYISFRSNSSQISAKWCTTSARPYNNLTAVAFEGLDLYVLEDGAWKFAGVGRPGHADCSESILVKNMSQEARDYLMYLPLYDGITNLEIGVDSTASLESLESPFQKQVLVYGTSITQGASASRPGLAYPSLLARKMGVDFINLGTSGSAKMEIQVARFLASQPMDAFIIDCVPNSSVDNIRERTAPFINAIREKHPEIPIIAIGGVIFESGNFDQQISRDIEQRNLDFLQEIERLQRDDRHLYYISPEGLLGSDHEGTIDGTHPNDIGFDRMVQKIKPILENILKRYHLL